MNEIMEKENIIIENMIYEIRGVEVMLDLDLAKLYQVETKRINEAVKNNPEKFPERFSFIITNTEKENLKSKFLTSSLKENNNYGGRRYNYRVFTEQGVYMLATILKSKVATEVNIRIIDILNEVNKEIIIIDNYAGKELLDILKSIDKKILIVSKNIDELLKYKYEKQYNNVTFINNVDFHDRFIIIDRKKLYSCGTSIKDIDKKCFAINEMESDIFLASLLEVIL